MVALGHATKLSALLQVQSQINHEGNAWDLAAAAKPSTRRSTCHDGNQANLRIALLSTVDPFAQTGQLPAPFRLFGGLRLIECQQAMALRSGCAAVFCLADRIGREIQDLRHAAEQAGARFTIVREAHDLLGLATTADDVLVLAPGLLPDEATLRDTLVQPAVMAFPADKAVPLGFERIDAETAWSGAMLVKASLIERLADLPPGIDPVSALLRVALQQGTPQVLVSCDLLDERYWQLAPSEQELEERAVRLIEQRANPASYRAPGIAVAERIGARLSRDVLGARTAQIPNLAALVAGIGGGLAAALEWPMLSLPLVALMTVLAGIGGVVDRVADPADSMRRSWLAKTLRSLVDPLILVSLSFAAPEADGWQRAYLPLAMLLALHLGQRLAKPRWRASFADRVLLTALFVPAAAFGLTQVLAAVVTLVALVSLFRLAGPAD